MTYYLIGWYNNVDVFLSKQYFKITEKGKEFVEAYGKLNLVSLLPHFFNLITFLNSTFYLTKI